MDYGPEIRHDGGECPYPDEIGFLRFRDGEVTFSSVPFWRWRWGGADFRKDIVAYRLRVDHPHYKARKRDDHQ